MEISATPRPGSGHRVLARVLLAVAVVLAVAVLTPAALGLEHHVVEDGGMGGSYPRGALVLAEPVMAEELEPGEVITFPSPVDTGEGTWVTRRIVEIQRDRLLTQRDVNAEADPWLVPLDDPGLRLVTRSVPWLGYPWLILGSAFPLVLGLLAAAFLAAAVLLRRRSRLGAGARPRRRPGATTDARARVG